MLFYLPQYMPQYCLIFVIIVIPGIKSRLCWVVPKTTGQSSSQRFSSTFSWFQDSQQSYVRFKADRVVPFSQQSTTCTPWCELSGLRVLVLNVYSGHKSQWCSKCQTSGFFLFLPKKNHLYILKMKKKRYVVFLNTVIAYITLLSLE